MKKLLFIIMFMPVIVFGMTCDVVKDTQTTLERNLVCDAKKSTITTFSFSSNMYTGSNVDYRCKAGGILKGNYCEYSQNIQQPANKVYQACPTGTSPSGDYCVGLGIRLNRPFSYVCPTGARLSGNMCLITTTKVEPAIVDGNNNSVCKITCTEEVVFSVDPIKKVLAGTSFNYPLYISGRRKCSATYNYVEYETKISRLVNEYNSLTGTAKATKANEIANYYHQKKLCDNFKVNGNELQNRYSFNGNVSLKIETSTSEVNVPYVFKEKSYDNVVIVDEVEYDSCNYNENSRKCSRSNKTVAGWSETSTIYGKYTMNDVFLEKYTGEVKNVNSSNSCNAGDRYFVSFSEVTKPVNTDPNDKGYKLTLTANKIGNNLGQPNNVWNLNVNCWYQVQNLIFPGKTDVNNEEFEGTAFQYRLIDLDNPFPNRQPGFNWEGKQDIIYSTKDNLSSLQKFVITLNRSSINKIREYNDVYPYDTFNLSEMEKSQFIESNINIIDRR